MTDANPKAVAIWRDPHGTDVRNNSTVLSVPVPAAVDRVLADFYREHDAEIRSRLAEVGFTGELLAPEWMQPLTRAELDRLEWSRS